MLRIFLNSIPPISVAGASDTVPAPGHAFRDVETLADAMADIVDGDVLLHCQDASFSEAVKVQDRLAYLYRAAFVAVDRYQSDSSPYLVYVVHTLQGMDQDRLVALADSSEFSMLARLVALARETADYQLLFDLATRLHDPHEGRRLTQLLTGEISKRGMDLADYQRHVFDDAVYPMKGANPKYPLLGVAEEVGEVIEKIEGDPALTRQMSEKEVLGILKEVGDASWYMSNLCSELGFDFAAVRRLADMSGEPWSAGDVTRLYKSVSRLCGLIGKADRDEGGKISSERRAKINDPVIEIVGRLSAIARRFGYAMEEVMAMNNDKVADRKRRGVLSGSGDDR